MLWWLYEMTILWIKVPTQRWGALFVILAAYLFWKKWPTRPTNDHPAPLWLCIALAAVAVPFILAAGQGLASRSADFELQALNQLPTMNPKFQSGPTPISQLQTPVVPSDFRPLTSEFSPFDGPVRPLISQ